MASLLTTLAPTDLAGLLYPQHSGIISNAGRLLADQVLRMGASLVVGVCLARYLGPQQFGLMNDVIAFTSLFGTFAALGLNGVVVRELVGHPEDEEEMFGMTTRASMSVIGLHSRSLGRGE